jgi:hypothetical protein
MARFRGPVPTGTIVAMCADNARHTHSTSGFVRYWSLGNEALEATSCKPTADTGLLPNVMVGGGAFPSHGKAGSYSPPSFCCWRREHSSFRPVTTPLRFWLTHAFCAPSSPGCVTSKVSRCIGAGGKRMNLDNSSRNWRETTCHVSPRGGNAFECSQTPVW